MYSFAILNTYQTLIFVGSTLSTTVFLLHMSDMIKTVPGSHVYTFADDTTLIGAAQNTPSITEPSANRTKQPHQIKGRKMEGKEGRKGREGRERR